MAPDRPVNLYQSHQYHHNNYAMTKPSLPLATTQQPPLNTHGSGVIVTRNTNDKEELARSLSKAFYITSYQSDTAHAGWPASCRKHVFTSTVHILMIMLAGRCLCHFLNVQYVQTN